MISSRRQSRSFVTLQINSRRHDYLPGISVLKHAMKELNVARNDIQAIGKRSPLVTPLGGKVFWVSREFRVQLQKIKKAYGSWGGGGGEERGRERRGEEGGGWWVSIKIKGSL